MRRILAVVATALALCLGGLTAQAQSTGTQAPSAPAVADTALTPGHGYAMGVRPYYYNICVANGYGASAPGPVTSWNDSGFQLHVVIQNRCDGYSVTNRMTIDNVNNAGACIQYSRLESTYPTKYQHGALWFGYIWNNNPVVWINTETPRCNHYPGQIYHNMAKGVGYILGLAYSDCFDCIMGDYTNGTTEATYGDKIDMNVIYRP